MIELKNINKSFKDHKVLNDLNLVIGENECIYIHGQNGCGKSTLFKIICDILKPDSGSIYLDDHTHLGALIENPGFIETETIKFNLHFLASLKKNYYEKEIVELCHMFSLDYNNRWAMKNYSVGMRQKVGIIQAVMEYQNVILFDEPTRGLDDESIHIFEELVNNLVLEHKSVIIASHDYLNHIHFTSQYKLINGKLEHEEVNS